MAENSRGESLNANGRQTAEFKAEKRGLLDLHRNYENILIFRPPMGFATVQDTGKKTWRTQRATKGSKPA